jgi:hypothetical protein
VTRHDAALRVPVGDGQKLFRDPAVVGVHQVESRHVIGLVRIESRGDQDQLRREALQGRQPVFVTALRKASLPVPCASGTLTTFAAVDSWPEFG